MTPSKCRDCNQPVLWKKVFEKNVPYNAKRYGDTFIATEQVHWDVCPVTKKWTICPACKIEVMGDINLIHKIKLDKPLCQKHSEQGYFQLPGFHGVEKYSTQDLYQLHKTLLREEKKEERKVEKLAKDGMEKHPLDGWVYDG